MPCRGEGKLCQLMEEEKISINVVYIALVKVHKYIFFQNKCLWVSCGPGWDGNGNKIDIKTY